MTSAPTRPAPRDPARDRELAAALRRAGVADVDDSGLAGRSTPPTPRCTGCCRGPSSGPGTSTRWSPRSRLPRPLGVPLTARGAGTSIAGNAVGPGVVLDTSRYLSPGARRSTPRRGRRRSSRASCRRPAGGGATARPAVRPRPEHAQPLHGRRDDRQQRLRLAGPGLRPDVGQRRGLDVVTGAGTRLDRGRRTAAGRRPRRPAPAGRGRAGDDPHRARPLRPPGVGLLPRAPAARARLRRGPRAGGQRGHAGAGARRHGPAGRRRPVPGPGRAGLPDDGRRGRRHPGLLPHAPDRRRGPGRPDGAAAARRARPPSSPTSRAARPGWSSSSPATASPR